MIWTQKQLIKNVIKHILNDDGFVYYVQEIDYKDFQEDNNTYKVSYKPFKDACKLRTEYSYNYYMDGLREFLNDNWMQDIEEFKEENPNATEEQLDKKNEELEKEFDKRYNHESLIWYLEEAIQGFNLEPNGETDA